MAVDFRLPERYLGARLRAGQPSKWRSTPARPQLQGPRRRWTRRSTPTAARCWCARAWTTPAPAAPGHVRAPARGLRVRECALVVPEEALVPQGGRSSSSRWSTARAAAGRAAPGGQGRPAPAGQGRDCWKACKPATWWSRPASRLLRGDNAGARDRPEPSPASPGAKAVRGAGRPASGSPRVPLLAMPRTAPSRPRPLTRPGDRACDCPKPRSAARCWPA
jgi:hypothetical protein